MRIAHDIPSNILTIFNKIYFLCKYASWGPVIWKMDLMISFGSFILQAIDESCIAPEALSTRQDPIGLGFWVSQNAL
jgi:hypothetical protein